MTASPIKTGALVCCLLTGLILQPACEPQHAAESAPGVRAQSITNGTPDASDLAVVAIVSKRLQCEEEHLTVLCTGTLVSPRVVVTAAHCVDNAAGFLTQIFVGHETTPSAGDLIDIREMRVHPDWDPDAVSNDIAVIALTRDASVLPVPLLDRTFDASFIDLRARIVGFGAAEPGTQRPPSLKRQGTALISEYGETDFRLLPDPSMSCEGDSGGPVLVTLDGTEFLAGVASWGDRDCVQFAVNTRVDAFAADFIIPFIQEQGDPFVDPRGPIDVETDYCSEPCDQDSECPQNMFCNLVGEGHWRCTYAALQPGLFGAECQTAAECGSGSCLRIYHNETSSCRCFTGCESNMNNNNNGSTTKRRGCSTAGSSDSGVAVVLVMLLLASWRRRRRGLLVAGCALLMALATVGCKQPERSAKPKTPKQNPDEVVVQLMDAIDARDCKTIKSLVGGKIAEHLKKAGCKKTFLDAQSVGFKLLRVVSSKPDGRDPKAHLVRLIILSKKKRTKRIARVENIDGAWKVVRF